MGKPIAILFSLLVIALISMGCVKKEEVESLEAKLGEYEEKVHRLTEQVDILEAELQMKEEEENNYKKIMQGFFEQFSDGELIAIAENLWFYQLRVNDEPINEDGRMMIATSRVEIVLVEQQLPYHFLPEDIYAKGQISGYYVDHLTVVDPEPKETSGRDGTVVTSYELSFEDIKQGEKVTLTISDELRSRLGLSTKEIIIERKN